MESRQVWSGTALVENVDGGEVGRIGVNEIGDGAASSSLS